MTPLVKNVFDEIRQPTDINLIEEVTKILAEAGHINPQGWAYGVTLQTAMDAAPRLQRFLINRHWRVALGLFGVQNPEIDTNAQRFCLLDQGTDQEFLNEFKNGVAPMIVKYSLF